LWKIVVLKEHGESLGVPGIWRKLARLYSFRVKDELEWMASQRF
jgi:hypothetical protein